MSRVINYKDLFVWQKSVDLAKNVYLLFPRINNEKLIDLMARTSISIASNIAEGNSRQISKEYRQFLYCALGDISQIDCQLILARELGFITHEEYTPFEDKVIELRKMLYGLISKLKQRPPMRPPYPSPGSPYPSPGSPYPSPGSSYAMPGSAGPNSMESDSHQGNSIEPSENTATADV